MSLLRLPQSQKKWLWGESEGDVAATLAVSGLLPDILPNWMNSQIQALPKNGKTPKPYLMLYKHGEAPKPPMTGREALLKMGITPRRMKKVS